MNISTNRKALVESALIATIASFFVISTVYIPILSILILLLPVPFMILSARHGTRYTVFALIIVSLLIGFLTGILYTIFVLIALGPMAVVMGYSLKRRHDAFQVIALGTLASAFSIFFIIQIVSTISGFNVIDQVAAMLRSVLDHQVEMLTTINIDTVSANEVFNYLMMLLPGLLIIQSMIGAFINYYITVAALKRFHFKYYELPEFSRFKLPGNIVIGTFIIFALVFFTKYIEGIDYNTLMANVTVIFIVIFFLQGLALLNYFMKKVNIHKVVRSILFAVLILISPAITLVAFMGLADSMFDIRKIRQK
jgi:uncharacterized protein YybS (DUF2232 family)